MHPNTCGTCCAPVQLCGCTGTYSDDFTEFFTGTATPTGGHQLWGNNGTYVQADGKVKGSGELVNVTMASLVRPYGYFIFAPTEDATTVTVTLGADIFRLLVNLADASYATYFKNGNQVLCGWSPYVVGAACGGPGFGVCGTSVQAIVGGALNHALAGHWYYRPYTQFTGHNQCGLANYAYCPTDALASSLGVKFHADKDVYLCCFCASNDPTGTVDIKVY